MTDKRIFLNIAINRLTEGDFLYLPYDSDPEVNLGRFVECLVMGVVNRIDGDMFSTSYELSLNSFIGPWDNEHKEATRASFDKGPQVITVSTLDDEEANVFLVQREQDLYYPKEMLTESASTERIIRYMHDWLLNLEPSGKDKIRRATFDQVVKQFQGIGWVSDDFATAKKEISYAINQTALGAAMIHSKGGWVKPLTTVEAMNLKARSFYSNNPDVNPARNGQIVIEWDTFQRGLRTLLSSISNIVILDD